MLRFTSLILAAVVLAIAGVAYASAARAKAHAS
jgi:hypothetical protein